MKILHFPKSVGIFFSVILVFKFRLLDYVILLHAAVLGTTLKGLLSICFQLSSFHI